MIPINQRPKLNLIVAQSDNRAIGKDNNLLWHLSGDLRRFKQLTMGYPIIMGRNTWESLPKKPLPGRRNIVLSFNPDYQADGAEVVHSINGLFSTLRNEEECFVIGGAKVYETLLPFADRLYVTWVHRQYEADTYFPIIDLSEFALVSQTNRLFDEASGLEYTYAEYDRRPTINLPR